MSLFERRNNIDCVYLPVAALCSRRTGIDRVAVVDAFADGVALDDLDAHCRFR